MTAQATTQAVTTASTKVPKRRVVQQQRSKDSQIKLLAAANELFAEKGFQRTKVTDIIQRSGCSIGSFYHQFTDKHGIFEVLFQQYLDTANSAIDTARYSPRTEPKLSQVLHKASKMAHQLLKNHLGARLAAEELVYQGESNLKDQAYQLTDKYVTSLTRLIPLYKEQIGNTNPEAAMANALQMIAMVMTSQTMRPTRHLPDNEDAFITILVEAAGGILDLKE